MFKANRKKLSSYIAILGLVIFVFLLAPALTDPSLSALKLPLSIASALGRELEAFVFFHRNYYQNLALKKEAGFLRFKLNAQKETLLESERLKTLLNFKQQSPFKVVSARVIGRSPDGWTSSVIIDKGRQNGVRRGMPVVNYAGLIGRVVEAGDVSAKILLASDPSLGVSAIVQRSRQEGLVSGTLGARLMMRYLPENPDIRLQDTVVTSGFNEAFPKGIPIGTVVDIGKEFSGLSRYCLIRPAVNLANIEEVLVVVQQ
ncbi:MAG: rod shape-determining protein MreC [Omnitrophica WOR_2 bacterium RIFCSPLOWO2_12_FULL_51_8]|nr:MAG: rod shape-determining protein MreC [Omnitrophica WOR_2 bacterium RIFCSPLOWO2_12_FULL_51_8]